MGIPNSWMVYKLRENPIYKWMMTGGTPILGNPHMYRQKTGLQKRNLLYFSQLQVQRIDHDTLLKASRSVRVLQRVLFYFTMESLIRPTRTKGSVKTVECCKMKCVVVLGQPVLCAISFLIRLQVVYHCISL